MYAKKSLGQNFLKSGSALHAIIVAGSVTPEDLVLEIGPGKGALTAKLLETGAKVIAVEKDHDLIPFLEEKFKQYIASGKFILTERDILNITVQELFKISKIKAKEYKLIANIPYYITGEIIRKFLEEENQPSKMVILVQKEVAMRIVAKDKKESILSMSVKAYGTPLYIKTVKRENFHPAPNVDSAIILIENISKDKFQTYGVNEKDFFEVMKAGFAHKRKRLGGNLKEYFKLITNETDLDIESIKNKRAEDLTLEEFLQLTQLMKK